LTVDRDSLFQGSEWSAIDKRLSSAARFRSKDDPIAREGGPASSAFDLRRSNVSGG
jgi:hypothetical protein